MDFKKKKFVGNQPLFLSRRKRSRICCQSVGRMIFPVVGSYMKMLKINSKEKCFYMMNDWMSKFLLKIFKKKNHYGNTMKCND